MATLFFYPLLLNNCFCGSKFCLSSLLTPFLPIALQKAVISLYLLLVFKYNSEAGVLFWSPSSLLWLLLLWPCANAIFHLMCRHFFYKYSFHYYNLQQNNLRLESERQKKINKNLNKKEKKFIVVLHFIVVKWKKWTGN